MGKFNSTELISIAIAIFSILSIVYDIFIVVKNNKNENSEKMKLPYGDILISSLTTIVAISFVFFIAPVHVSGDSMEPTYSDGQWLLEIKPNQEYKTGDVIVFYAPKKDKKLIKRVIAHGGDTVEVKNKKLYINGELFENDYTPIQFESDVPAITVPNGEYFVLGDNRTISLDSRYEVIGTIKPEYIEGKIISFK